MTLFNPDLSRKTLVLRTLCRPCCLAGLLIIGCGEAPQDYQVIEQTVTVKTSSGQEKVVPLNALSDQASGAPAFQSVLVVDRQRNRRTFISLDQLPGETQATARYVLVTSSGNADADADD